MPFTTDFLNENIFFLATSTNNTPKLRPFGAVMEYNEKLYFSTANFKDVYQQLKDNSAIEIVSLKNNSRKWLRISGKAVEDNDITVKKAMLKVFPDLTKRFEIADKSEFAIFSIEEAKITLYKEVVQQSFYNNFHNKKPSRAF